MKIVDATLEVESAPAQIAALKSLEAASHATTLEGVLANSIKHPKPHWGDLEYVNKARDLNTDYHKQALSQANVQFWFSVFAATVGFGWILYTGTEVDPERFLTWSRLIPGVVIEGVAYLFFRQAAATRYRATELLDRLRKDTLIAHAVDLAGDISQEEIRNMVKANLALHMAGLKPSQIDVRKFLS
jgi:hypothetical protein